jgi:hypothetical protein
MKVMQLERGERDNKTLYTKYSAKMRSKAKKKKRNYAIKKSENLKTMSIQNKNSQHNSIHNSVLRNVMNIEVHILARQERIQRYTNHQPKQSSKNLSGTVTLLLLLHLHFGRKHE